MYPLYRVCSERDESCMMAAIIFPGGVGTGVRELIVYWLCYYS